MHTHAGWLIWRVRREGACSIVCPPATCGFISRLLGGERGGAGGANNATAVKSVCMCDCSTAGMSVLFSPLCVFSFFLSPL